MLTRSTLLILPADDFTGSTAALLLGDAAALVSSTAAAGEASTESGKVATVAFVELGSEYARRAGVAIDVTSAIAKISETPCPDRKFFGPLIVVILYAKLN
ncbi:MAG TPA: hypothetical protein PLD46_06285 [Hyphomicrobium sp.]|nr:hypothetical protein [Hyphomicrobium sp.]